MPLPDLDRALRCAASAAREAGTLLRRHAGHPRGIRTKRSAIDLVTAVDRASERLIRRRLERAYPAFGVLGEEHGLQRPHAPCRWIIDPLDGTMNFVHGVPLFGVSIALYHRAIPLVGVIYDPSREELFTAVAGRGARLNGRRIGVSRAARLQKSLLATGFSSRFRRHPAEYVRWFTTFESRTHSVRRIGTTVLCLAYVAAGRLEVFYERDLWPWDIAAGILLVTEAGGRVSGFDGRPAVLERGELVASNGLVHSGVLRVLRST